MVTRVTILPATEKQVRELTRCESDDQAAEVWRQIVDDSECPEKITARGERRLGELMEGMPKSKGAMGDSRNQHAKEVRGNKNPAPTLDDCGIDKNLAKAARIFM